VRFAAMGVIRKCPDDLREQRGVGLVVVIRRMHEISCTDSHAHAEYESREPARCSYPHIA
jgi:hypothetical protein